MKIKWLTIIQFHVNYSQRQQVNKELTLIVAAYQKLGATLYNYKFKKRAGPFFMTMMPLPCHLQACLQC